MEVFDNSEKHVISKTQTNVVESLIGRYVRRKVENFICDEDLGTEITPRCGSCRCGKRPVVGHTYSFKEEHELKLIHENLEYDVAHQCWVISYPWLVDPSTLPKKYQAALEQTLSKDKLRAKTYQRQMEDMQDRGVARMLPEEELQKWSGPLFSISHLAVVNPKSNSTPVRVVFNSSQLFPGNLSQFLFG